VPAVPQRQITYSTPCAVDSRLLTPWWIMVESATDRDVFFSPHPLSSLPRLTRSISSVLHSCIRRSYYYYYIRYNAPTTTSTVDSCLSSPKRPPISSLVVPHCLGRQGGSGMGILRSALGSCCGCKVDRAAARHRGQQRQSLVVLREVQPAKHHLRSFHPSF
jgi:hypothetical protein